MDKLGMGGGMEFLKWLQMIGRERATGYRWIVRGWVTTCNIAGHLFITFEEIQRFWQRARNGEFAQEPGGIIEEQKNEQPKKKSQREPETG